ncbi:MAG: MFS transporter [Piscirickettsiaceae bacterium]|nr:MAG: MFS transporter [Piscirickettsiaceae bacterium]
MRTRTVLLVLVFAVFSGSSLWFSSNAILIQLSQVLPNANFDISDITSAVQFGFIVGTLTFALLNVSDRFSAGRVFLISSTLGSLSNALIVYAPLDSNTLILSRCLTGFFLAGIYPVGVKIASLWCQHDLGRALGHIVGALVVGTAFPHFINSLDLSLDWQWVIISSSSLAIIGGLLVGFLIPEKSIAKRTPHHEGKALLNIFKSNDFRASSSGYFGHMWELYTFWAFVPIILTAYATQFATNINIPLWSFLIIAAGGIGCSAGGLLTLKLGSARIAFYQLATSGLCCLVFPFLFSSSIEVFLAYLIIWGITVAGDSPQFSTLNAKTAPPEILGSAITLVICIGFTLTIVSLQVFEFILANTNLQIAVLLLVLGPLYGLYKLRPLTLSIH